MLTKPRIWGHLTLKVKGNIDLEYFVSISLNKYIQISCLILHCINFFSCRHWYTDYNQWNGDKDISGDTRDEGRWERLKIFAQRWNFLFPNFFLVLCVSFPTFSCCTTHEQHGGKRKLELNWIPLVESSWRFLNPKSPQKLLHNLHVSWLRHCRRVLC